MVKGIKRSKEVIEEEKDDDEHAYVKFPGKELVDASRTQDLGETSLNYARVAKLMKEYQKSSYGTAHDHDYDIPIPSINDLRNLLGDDRQKYMAISQKDPEGKVSGYFFLKKTKKTPKMDYSLTDLSDPELRRDYMNQHKGIIGKLRLLPIIGRTLKLIYNTNKFEKNFQKEFNEYGESQSLDALDEFSKKYNLRYRFVPAKDYQFDKETLNFEKKGNLEELSRSTMTLFGVLSIISFLISLIFLASNITGNVIWNINKNNLGIISSISFILGIIFLFLYTNNKRK